MNRKRLQLGPFWSARPRGHNRRLHQVRPNYSCISAFPTTDTLHFSWKYTRAISGSCFVALSCLFLVVSPGGREGWRRISQFRIHREAKLFTALAKPQNMYLPACTYVPWKVRLDLIAKFLKFAKQESNKVQLAPCRLGLWSAHNLSLPAFSEFQQTNPISTKVVVPPATLNMAQLILE